MEIALYYSVGNSMAHIYMSKRSIVAERLFSRKPLERKNEEHWSGIAAC